MILLFLSLQNYFYLKLSLMRSNCYKSSKYLRRNKSFKNWVVFRQTLVSMTPVRVSRWLQNLSWKSGFVLTYFITTVNNAMLLVISLSHSFSLSHSHTNTCFFNTHMYTHKHPNTHFIKCLNITRKEKKLNLMEK